MPPRRAAPRIVAADSRITPCCPLPNAERRDQKLWRCALPRPKLNGRKMEAGEILEELAIVASDFLADRDVAGGGGAAILREIRVRPLRMVHETAIVDFIDHETRSVGAWVGVAVEQFAQMRRCRLVFLHRNQPIEIGIEPPDRGALADRLGGENTDAFDGALGDIGSDQQHWSGPSSTRNGIVKSERNARLRRDIFG